MAAKIFNHQWYVNPSVLCFVAETEPAVEGPKDGLTMYATLEVLLVTNRLGRKLAFSPRTIQIVWNCCGTPTSQSRIWVMLILLQRLRLRRLALQRQNMVF